MQAQREHLRLAPVNLVVEQQRKKLDVTETLILGLAAAQLQGVQHAAEAQCLELGLQLGRPHRRFSKSTC